MMKKYILGVLVLVFMFGISFLGGGIKKAEAYPCGNMGTQCYFWQSCSTSQVGGSLEIKGVCSLVERGNLDQNLINDSTNQGVSTAGGVEIKILNVVENDSITVKLQDGQSHVFTPEEYSYDQASKTAFVKIYGLDQNEQTLFISNGRNEPKPFTIPAAQPLQVSATRSNLINAQETKLGFFGKIKSWFSSTFGLKARNSDLTKNTKDLCSNLSGNQFVVPSGFSWVDNDNDGRKESCVCKDSSLVPNLDSATREWVCGEKESDTEQTQVGKHNLFLYSYGVRYPVGDPIPKIKVTGKSNSCSGEYYQKLNTSIQSYISSYNYPAAVQAINTANQNLTSSTSTISAHTADIMPCIYNYQFSQTGVVLSIDNTTSSGLNINYDPNTTKWIGCQEGLGQTNGIHTGNTCTVDIINPNTYVGVLISHHNPTP